MRDIGGEGESATDGRKVDRAEGNEDEHETGEWLVLELVRQPIASDLAALDDLGSDPERADLSYRPFHWPVEFPEVVTSNGNGYEVNFDIVVGNPPYGNLLSEIERRFTAGYNTGSLNEVVMQFIERQLQILAESGTFGNIITLRWAYQKNADTVRDMFRTNLENCRNACFTTRPSQVFDSSEPRVSITTGRKRPVARNGDDHELLISRFIRFTEDDRAEKLANIEYCSCEGVVLGDRIGDGQDFALPKVGSQTAKSVLTQLKANSDRVFSEVMETGASNETPWTVWRNYHPRYWINPCVENVYDLNSLSKSRDFKPMYFESELERDAAFLVMGSSLYYFYWMVYENQLDLNWGTVNAFPLPERSALEEHAEVIHALSEKTWREMECRFKPDAGLNGEFQDIGELKPLFDRVDELFGPMYGLNDEQIAFIQNYDIEYRMNDVDDAQLISFDLELEP